MDGVDVSKGGGCEEGQHPSSSFSFISLCYFFSNFQSSALGVRVPFSVGVWPRGGEVSKFRKINSSFRKHLLSVCHVSGTLVNPEETPGTVVLTV